MKILVIGAGILGASAAYHLARDGAQVIVADSVRNGRATAAGAGIICPWVSGIEDQALYPLYTAGGEYYPELVEALAEHGETDLGYRRNGAMLVAEKPDELAQIETLARRRSRASPAMGEVTRLSPAEACSIFPVLHPDLAGVHVAGGARVDGRRMAAALLSAAQRHGATLLSGDATLWRDCRRAVAKVNGDRIDADWIVVAAGAWLDRLLAPLGLGLGVTPQRGQIVHLHLQNARTETWPVILPLGSHYIVPFDGGRVVVGATRETGAGFDYRVTAAGQMEVLLEALRIAPGLAPATVIETRVGFRPVVHGAPLLGWLPDTDNVVIGNGLGAAGLTIGPLAGRLIAELVGGREPMFPLEPFDPARRSRGRTEATPALR